MPVWNQILLQVLGRGLWGHETAAVSFLLKVKAGPWQPECHLGSPEEGVIPAAISLNSPPKLWQEPPHSPEDTCRWISALRGPLESPTCCEPLKMSQSGPGSPELNSWAPCSLSRLCSTRASEREELAWGVQGAPDARETLALEGGHSAGLSRAGAPQRAGHQGLKTEGQDHPHPAPPPGNGVENRSGQILDDKETPPSSSPIWGPFSPPCSQMKLTPHQLTSRPVFPFQPKAALAFQALQAKTLELFSAPLSPVFQLSQIWGPFSKEHNVKV